jgi:hypothetical protein
VVAIALPASAQEEERLWMPEGYRLLSVEERQGLPLEDLKAIFSKNTALLEESLSRMTSSERVALGQELERFKQTHTLSDVEKQYVTIVSMRILAGGIEEHHQKQKDAEKARFEKLLRDQEETRGFPTDEKSVETEANAVETAVGHDDPRKLYLRILRPLRARPWNDSARVIFRRLVRGDSEPGSKGGTLYDAALAFLHTRQAEAPEQGSWFSLEAFLRLSLRGEVAEAKRLFSIAIAKNSRDIEGYVYPLLIAEIEENETERVRLWQRARRIWPKEGDLDVELYRQLPMLPSKLQVRARATFERRYKRTHPADWDSRIEIVRGAIHDNHLQEVEEETTGLLSLPVSVLPEPYRSEFLTLNLLARAGLGKCDEVTAQIPVLERSADLAYPREADPDATPVPKTVSHARQLRASLPQLRREFETLKTSLADASPDRSPGASEIPKEQREALMKTAISRMQDDLREIETLPWAENDEAVAAEWSLRDLARWKTAHNIVEDQVYDLYGNAERLSLLVRSALGKCFLAQRKPLAAVAVLKPCVGGGENFHLDCIFPLVDAGVTLAEAGRVNDAAAVYAIVSLTFASTDKLYDAIEKATPGLVKRYVPPPMKPFVLPTPLPTPHPTS